jgi:hypothetical protein
VFALPPLSRMTHPNLGVEPDARTNRLVVVALRSTAVRGSAIGALSLALLTGCAGDPQHDAARQGSADRGQPFALYTTAGSMS